MVSAATETRRLKKRIEALGPGFHMQYRTTRWDGPYGPPLERMYDLHYRPFTLAGKYFVSFEEATHLLDKMEADPVWLAERKWEMNERMDGVRIASAGYQVIQRLSWASSQINPIRDALESRSYGFQSVAFSVRAGHFENEYLGRSLFYLLPSAERERRPSKCLR